MKMAKDIFQKAIYFILIFIFLLGCKKDEVSSPDPILGNWEVNSVSGAGETIIWKDLKAT